MLYPTKLPRRPNPGSIINLPNFTPLTSHIFQKKSLARGTILLSPLLLQGGMWFGGGVMTWVEAIPDKRRRNKRQRSVSRRSRLHVLEPVSHSSPSYLKPKTQLQQQKNQIILLLTCMVSEPERARSSLSVVSQCLGYLGYGFLGLSLLFCKMVW